MWSRPGRWLDSKKRVIPSGVPCGRRRDGTQSRDLGGSFKRPTLSDRRGPSTPLPMNHPCSEQYGSVSERNRAAAVAQISKSAVSPVSKPAAGAPGVASADWEIRDTADLEVRATVPPARRFIPHQESPLRGWFLGMTRFFENRTLPRPRAELRKRRLLLLGGFECLGALFAFGAEFG